MTMSIAPSKAGRSRRRLLLLLLAYLLFTSSILATSRLSRVAHSELSRRLSHVLSVSCGILRVFYFCAAGGHDATDRDFS